MADPKTGAPPKEGTPSSAFTDQFHAMQMLIELSKDIAALSTKTDRLISDNEKLSSDVSDLSKKISRYENRFFGGAFVLLAIASMIGWFFGAQLTDLKDQITQSTLKLQQQSK
ncbi:hypothetical protein [Rhizobium sp. ZX09]|uniref:hypothetical protein n=1 Tax=Rhizobium sp. ZX09 TaxID=2291939 RepID=UPI001A992CC4|nr:hypothetical protein [Rhizobium sp. ZX09]QSZ59136.1 hypothetical protein BTN45_18070 [Rhizobium sp. ZX09]